MIAPEIQLAVLAALPIVIVVAILRVSAIPSLPLAGLLFLRALVQRLRSVVALNAALWRPRSSSDDWPETT